MSGYDGVAQRISTLPFENRSALDRCGTWIVELYENWGKMEKAAEWQSKRPTAAPQFHWGFRVELPPCHLGPGWRRRLERLS